MGHPTAALHAPCTAKPLTGVALGQNYPTPIEAHAAERALTLQRYAAVKKSIQAHGNYHLPPIQ